MIYQIYLTLLRHPFTRKYARSIRSMALRFLKVPDAFSDLSMLSKLDGVTIYLDIGCHHGDTIIRAIDSGVRCPIYAFDPVGENIIIAKEKLASYQNVSFFQVALSDKSETRSFYVNRNEQTSSLLQNDIGNNISFPEDTTPVKTIQLSTTTLDDWIDSNFKTPGKIIIKCDVQGFEEYVVKGGMKTFESNVVALYAEIMLTNMYKDQTAFENFSNLLERDFDMVIRNVYSSAHDSAGRAVQTDILWVKREVLAKFAC